MLCGGLIIAYQKTKPNQTVRKWGQQLGQAVRNELKVSNPHFLYFDPFFSMPILFYFIFMFLKNLLLYIIYRLYCDFSFFPCVGGPLSVSPEPKLGSS